MSEPLTREELRTWANEYARGCYGISNVALAVRHLLDDLERAEAETIRVTRGRDSLKRSLDIALRRAGRAEAERDSFKAGLADRGSALAEMDVRLARVVRAGVALEYYIFHQRYRCSSVQGPVGYRPDCDCGLNSARKEWDEALAAAKGER